MELRDEMEEDRKREGEKEHGRKRRPRTLCKEEWEVEGEIRESTTMETS